MENNQRKNGAQKFFRRFFNTPQAKQIPSDVPEGLPESIEEMNELVKNLSSRITEFSAENERLVELLNGGARIRKILLLISIVSIMANILLIVRVK